MSRSKQLSSSLISLKIKLPGREERKSPARTGCFRMASIHRGESLRSDARIIQQYSSFRICDEESGVLPYTILNPMIQIEDCALINYDKEGLCFSRVRSSRKGSACRSPASLPGGGFCPDAQFFGQDISIRISDQGGGVPRAVLPHVFDFGFSTVGQDMALHDW